MSRVGGNAQIKAMRQVAGSLRLDLAQYRELAAFAQFGSDQLDKATQAQLARGQRLVEILKQGQFSPLSVEEQVVVIFAGTSGLIDDVPVLEVQRFQKDLVEFIHTRYGALLAQIATEKADYRRRAGGAEARHWRIQGAIHGRRRGGPRLDRRAEFSMPTLLDFRRRIRSVKNTQQITRAMKFIAAARLRRAQETAVSLRPYAGGIREVLGSAMSRLENPDAFPLLAERPEERILVVVAAGERGLCGAFNANVLRRAFEFLGEHRATNRWK